jgi:hypothetical protein
VRRKLNHYVLAAQAGVVGPDQFLPRVLVCVPDDKRLLQVEELIRSMSPDVKGLLHATTLARAVAYVLQPDG